MAEVDDALAHPAKDDNATAEIAVQVRQVNPGLFHELRREEIA